MIEMFLDSITLFLKGRLFKDLGHFFRQAAIGIAVSTIVIVVAVKVGLSLWIAIVVASLLAGALQPYLFKDLKYA